MIEIFIEKQKITPFVDSIVSSHSYRVSFGGYHAY